MSLINITPPPTPTVAQAQKQLVQSLQFSCTNLFKQMVQVFTANWNSVWNNPVLTPVQAFAALGTNGVIACEYSAALGALINQVVPNTVNYTIPSGWNLTPNADGSITAVYTAPDAKK